MPKGYYALIFFVLLNESFSKSNPAMIFLLRCWKFLIFLSFIHK